MTLPVPELTSVDVERRVAESRSDRFKVRDATFVFFPAVSCSPFFSQRNVAAADRFVENLVSYDRKRPRELVGEKNHPTSAAAEFVSTTVGRIGRSEDGVLARALALDDDRVVEDAESWMSAFACATLVERDRADVRVEMLRTEKTHAVVRMAFARRLVFFAQPGIR
jgi:hypothetical protein